MGTLPVQDHQARYDRVRNSRMHVKLEAVA